MKVLRPIPETKSLIPPDWASLNYGIKYGWLGWLARGADWSRWSDHHLTKPCEIDELVAKIEKAWEKKDDEFKKDLQDSNSTINIGIDKVGIVGVERKVEIVQENKKFSFYPKIILPESLTSCCLKFARSANAAITPPLIFIVLTGRRRKKRSGTRMRTWRARSSS